MGIGIQSCGSGGLPQERGESAGARQRCVPANDAVTGWVGVHDKVTASRPGRLLV